MSIESLAFLYFCLVGLIKHFVRSSPNTFLISGSACNSVLIISSISVEVISCVCRFSVATNGRRICEVFIISYSTQMYEVPERNSNGKATRRYSGSLMVFRYIDLGIDEGGEIGAKTVDSVKR